MDLDAKQITELITAVGAVIAAFKSWFAHDESKKAHAESRQTRELLTQIRAEITSKQTTSVTVINSPAQTVGAGTGQTAPPDPAEPNP